MRVSGLEIEEEVSGFWEQGQKLLGNLSSHSRRRIRPTSYQRSSSRETEERGNRSLIDAGK